MLRFYRDTCAKLPDEMMLVAGMQTAPDGSSAKVVALSPGIADRSTRAKKRSRRSRRSVRR